MGKLWGGAGLVVLALFMLMGFLNSDLDKEAPATLLALGIAVLLPGAGGAALIASHFRGDSRVTDRKAALRQQTLDAEILRLAGRAGGKLTVVEVVGELAVTPEAALAALNDLARRDLANHEITDSGVIVYAFHDIQRLSEKSKAKGLLDD